MNFTPEHWITIIVALLAASPVWINIMRSVKKNKATTETDYQKKVMLLTDIISHLLSLLSTYDMILQRVFFDNPAINSGLKQKWVDANHELGEVRVKLKDI